MQGLRDKGQLQDGQTVLINGAGGGVGTFALQIAKTYSAEVTCVDTSNKLDLLKSLGADYVIDYTQEDFVRNGRKYDLILDVVGNRSVFDYKRLLKHKGKYVMVGGSLSLILQILFFGPFIYKREGKKMSILLHKPNKNDQNFLSELFVAGKVKPVIDRRYSLNQLPEAILYLGEGRSKGKIVILVEHHDM